MGKCEKCPINFGITTAENVIQGFKPETLKNENSDAVRISRNTAMARAAYDQAVTLIDCHYDPDYEPEVVSYEQTVLDDADFDETTDGVDTDDAPEDEDAHVQSQEEVAMAQMLLGSEAPHERRACLEHFQIALQFLMVNTPAGSQTVFPDGNKLPPHTQQSGGNGTGQYL